MKKRKFVITIGIISGIVATVAVGCKVLNKKEENNPAYDSNGLKRKLAKSATFYEKRVKRGIDVTVAFIGAIVTAPIVAVSSILIFIEDPGSVIFKQKRVGINKSYFDIHKLRSMKQNSGDIPTHLLSQEEQDRLILRIGRIIRKTSIDELPQFIDIIRGRMSMIGPRPALWNQDDLIAERDKYGANDVLPGLTGWAQINGRDSISIEEKAKLDGQYRDALRKNSIDGFLMDCKCFFRTIDSVLHSEGVVEGGTGSMQNSFRDYIEGKSQEEIVGNIGFDQSVIVDKGLRKKILITGAGSYIGEAFTAYAKNHYSMQITVDTVDMIGDTWREMDFSEYDIVYHVAGIAHADVGSVSDETKEKYYAVNTDLAIETANKAKAEGVSEFIFMSSMIVYGDSAPYGKTKVVDKNTIPIPVNFYGDSKLQADVAIRDLADEKFKVIVLRPPMIYGKGSKGNYPTLAKIARIMPFFPDADNQRSMLHIDNLCEFLCQIMLVKEIERNSIVLFPQNAAWVKTSDMVSQIAAVYRKKRINLKALRPIVSIGGNIPGKIGSLVNKAFGNSCYALELSRYEGIDYQIVDLKESIIRTESNTRENSDSKEDDRIKRNQGHILVISQYFYPETFRINDMCQEWVKRGYKVTVLTGIPNYPMGKFFEGYGYCKKRKTKWNGIDIIRIPLIPRGCNSLGMVANYASFTLSGLWFSTFRDIDADLVFTFEVSPMTQALIGCRYAKKHHIPHFLYVQDLWPENVITVTGITNPMIITPINKMVDKIYRESDEIFTTSPSFVEEICNRKVKVPSGKVHYWPQYAESFYKPLQNIKVPEIQDDDTFKIVFTGNIGTAQGLEILPKTAELLKDTRIKFIIVGDGRYLEGLTKEIGDRKVTDKFIMIPRQPAERIPEIMSACDAAFLSFQKDDLWKKTIPAKLQSYLACGMPIIASAEGETERIINESECGICCNIGDAKSLYEGVLRLMNSDLSKMRKESLNYFSMNFTKKELMDEMDGFILKSLESK